MSHPNTPLVLAILDGWGYREGSEYNAIKAAKTRNWDRWWNTCPHALIEASGTTVGLPSGQMGNSEVGHMHIGAGRLLQQDLTRINEAISDDKLKDNEVLQSAIDYSKKNKKAIHVLGLVSPGGVHSHEQQILAICKEIVQHGIHRVYLHAFLDGRDTPPKSAEKSLALLQSVVTIASIVGRYFAMDRDQRWERTKIAYDLLTGVGETFEADNAIDALHQAYERGEDDEFVKPTRIKSTPMIEDGDVILFSNFRADRARQLCHAFLDHHFSSFERSRVYRHLTFVTLTDYAGGIKTNVMFAPESQENTLGEYLSHLNYRQLRIAETEKYPHVTYFLNGGREEPFPGEERILIPSPRVATYDLQPEMNAPIVTERCVNVISQKKMDVIILNFANPDMVGHTGNYAATIKAIECIDECLGKIEDALQQVSGEMIITADHGNAETMYDLKTKQPVTSHTSEKIPFLYLGRPAKIVRTEGSLIDIAPTVLYVLGLEKPREMTGSSLIAFGEGDK